MKNATGASRVRTRISSRPGSVKITPYTNPVLQGRRVSQLLEEDSPLNAATQTLFPLDDCFYNTIAAPRIPQVHLRPRRSASFVAEQAAGQPKPLTVEELKADRKTRKHRKKKVRPLLPQKEIVLKGFKRQFGPGVVRAVFDFQAILNVTCGKLVF